MKSFRCLVAAVIVALSGFVWAQGPIRGGTAPGERREGGRGTVAPRTTPRRIVILGKIPKPTDVPSSATLTQPIPSPTSTTLPQGRRREPSKIVVAAVEKEHLSMQDVWDQVALIRSPRLSGSADVVERYRRAYGNEILNDWVDTRLLVMEARARGFTVSNDEIERYVQGTAQESGLKVPVAAQLRRIGLPEEKFRQTIADAILCDKVIRQVIRETVPDSYLREVYDKSPALFWVYPRRHVRQICLQFKGNETESDIRAMERRMNSIRRSIVWFGTKFEEYVAKHPAENFFYHDLGWLAMGDNITPRQRFIYDNVAFRIPPPKAGKEPEYALKVGEVSEVMRSPDSGFHLFQIVEELPARRKTFEEAREELESGWCFTEARRKLMKDLEKKYRVYRDPEGFFELESQAKEELTTQIPVHLKGRRGGTAGPPSVPPPPGGEARPGNNAPSPTP